MTRGSAPGDSEILAVTDREARKGRARAMRLFRHRPPAAKMILPRGKVTAYNSSPDTKIRRVTE